MSSDQNYIMLLKLHFSVDIGTQPLAHGKLNKIEGVFDIFRPIYYRQSNVQMEVVTLQKTAEFQNVHTFKTVDLESSYIYFLYVYIYFQQLSIYIGQDNDY